METDPAYASSKYSHFTSPTVLPPLQQHFHQLPLTQNKGLKNYWRRTTNVAPFSVWACLNFQVSWSRHKMSPWSLVNTSSRLPQQFAYKRDRSNGWHQRLAVSKGKWREINTLQAAPSYCCQGMDRAFPTLMHRSMWHVFQSSYHNEVRFMTLLYTPCLEAMMYSNFLLITGVYSSFFWFT